MPIDQSAPEGAAPIEPASVDWSSEYLDVAANVAVTDILSVDTKRAINTVTWDEARDVVTFYVHGSTASLNKKIAAAMPREQAWEIIPAVRSITEVEQLIESIATDPSALPSGVTFVSGTPAADGSSITIGVDTEGAATLGSAPLPDSLGTVPVTFVEEKPAVPTTRVRSIAPIIAGGYTEGTLACTAGFPVLRYADSQYNMITADHCAADQGETWYLGFSSTHSIGTSTWQAPGDTDLELYIEPSSLSTWVFVGSHTDASTVAPVRGYLAPVGGNSVCYSGSRSGLVCSNVLESSDTFNCVAFGQCYWTRWSTQSSGTPAAGNGDSGGPVIIPVLRESDNTVGAYGVGIISMIANYSANCTGDPGSTAQDGRKCSANVGFARLSRWTSAQSTHNLVYTTQ